MGNEQSTNNDQNVEDLLRHNVPIKLPMGKNGAPMPDKEELDARFASVMASVNLNPENAQFLMEYDDKKKWNLILEHDGMIVKKSPQVYTARLKSIVNSTSKKEFKRSASETANLLRELEISLRTNHVGWVKEFLNEYKGLDALVDFIKFACWGFVATSIQSSNANADEDDEIELEQGDKDVKNVIKQFDTLRRSTRLPSKRTIKNSVFLLDRDEVHLCILCFRAVLSYKHGMTAVFAHKTAMNQICLALNTNNIRTKAHILDMLAGLCLVDGGHEYVLRAFDNFKEVMSEKIRFSKMMGWFKQHQDDVDFLHSCLQFINLVIHSGEHLQC